jgi:hypothetical protein
MYTKCIPNKNLVRVATQEQRKYDDAFCISKIVQRKNEDNYLPPLYLFHYNAIWSKKNKLINIINFLSICETNDVIIDKSMHTRATL